MLSSPAGIAAMAIAAVTASLVALKTVISALLANISKLDKEIKAATALGESTANVQALTFALGEVAGMDATGTQMALRNLSKAVGEAGLVGGQGAKYFKILGINISELSQLSPAAQFEKMVVALREHNNQMEAAAIAQQFFGRQSKLIMTAVNSATSNFEEAEEAAKRFGLTLSEPQARGIEMANDAVGRLSAALEGIFTQMTAEFAPLVTVIAKEFGSLIPLGGSMTMTLHYMVDATVMVLGITLDLYQAYKGLARILEGDIKGGAVEFGAAMKGVNTLRLMDSLKRTREEAAAAAEKMQEQLESMNGLAEGADTVTAEYDKQVDALNLQLVALREGEDAAERIKLKDDGYTPDQIDYLENLRKTIALEKQRAEAEKKANDDRKKAAGDRARELDKMVADAEKALQSDTSNALAAAKAYFEGQRKLEIENRKAISAGPGAGMEVGSDAAAKFMAEQTNAAIGAAAIPEKPTPGDREIIERSRIAFDESRRANKEQERLLAKVAEAVSNNGFSRVR
jgi:hypothetical protein